MCGSQLFHIYTDNAKMRLPAIAIVDKVDAHDEPSTPSQRDDERMRRARSQVMTSTEDDRSSQNRTADEKFARTGSGGSARSRKTGGRVVNDYEQTPPNSGKRERKRGTSGCGGGHKRGRTKSGSTDQGENGSTAVIDRSLASDGTNDAQLALLANPTVLHCICRKPYDSRLFYVCCDVCSRWFHGRCVHVSQRQARAMDSFVCAKCVHEHESRTDLYCVCKQPYDDKE
jgi:hypothetical protein